MKRIKLLITTLLIAVSLLIGGLKTLNTTPEATGSTICRIDTGFYTKQGDKPLDPKFSVSLSGKSPDSNFFVGQCGK